MNYGTISVKTILIAGKVTRSFVLHDESLPVHSEVEAAELFYDMLEQLKQGKLINPGIQVEVYPDTGRIKRVVKSWTEVK
jgi:hypothetical protein